MESSSLLVNLVVALSAGLLGAIVAARLGQSVILGYILAGVVIGPFTPGFVGDAATVEALAEIGIILLMFAIGVQFSMRELLAAGKIVTVGATAQVLITIGLGYLVGVALGWNWLEALFFGAVVSNSSSTVLSKVLGERAEMDTAHGRLALAWSTVQDLSTVILIVVLSSLATDSDALLADLAWQAGKATLFLALLIPVGLRVMPWIFARAAGLRNREVFVLTVAAVALGVAYSASFFGLSLALGAFVAGVVVGESDLSHQILGEVLPLRDIFAGIFFVSVGMLVDPAFVAQNFPLVLVTLILIVPVKGALTALLAAMLGSPTRTAVLVGAILAQSAEFSFLLARVGSDLDAVSPLVFNLMLAAAAASIVLLPGVYRGSLPLARSFEGWRPTPIGGMSTAAGPEPAPEMRGHAVICGYGRVGRVIGVVLRHRFTFVVIDEDPRVVQQLRADGIAVIQGNSAVPAVLERANLARARMLVLAIPDPVATRQIVDQVREQYPRLDIVARTHSEAEREFLLGRGVDEVVLGEWELALEMTRHTLGRFGVGTLEVQAVIQRLRGQAHLPTLAAPMEEGVRERSRAAILRTAGRAASLLDAEAPPGRGLPEEEQRQRGAEEAGVHERPRQRLRFLRKSLPADRRRDRAEIDQPEHQAVNDPGAEEGGEGARQPPSPGDEGAEGRSEHAGERQLDK